MREDRYTWRNGPYDSYVWNDVAGCIVLESVTEVIADCVAVALNNAVRTAEAERDAALRNLAACKPWLKNRLPFNVAKAVDDACAVIEAARKMGDER